MRGTMYETATSTAANVTKLFLYNDLMIKARSDTKTVPTMASSKLLEAQTRYCNH